LNDTQKAARVYQGFREETPRRARHVSVDIPKALAVVGACEFIGYVTTTRGRTELYIHEFAPGSRPYLAAGPRRNQLFLVGGRYRFTSRGITDLDANGRPIDARPRYKVTLLHKNRP
jgi:hypothetical protein